MRSQHLHERRARHTRQLRPLSDSDAFRPHLFDDPEAAQLLTDDLGIRCDRPRRHGQIDAHGEGTGGTGHIPSLVPREVVCHLALPGASAETFRDTPFMNGVRGRVEQDYHHADLKRAGGGAARRDVCRPFRHALDGELADAGVSPFGP